MIITSIRNYDQILPLDHAKHVGPNVIIRPKRDEISSPVRFDRHLRVTSSCCDKTHGSPPALARNG